MRLLCQAAVLLSLLSVPGWSDPTLYSNGGILGDPTQTSSLDTLNTLPQYGIFDTFNISSDSVVTGVSNIGLWVVSGDAPSSLSWAICLSICSGLDGSQVGVLAYGDNVGLSSGLVEANASDSGYDIYSAGFSVEDLSLSAGTYTLELFDGVDADCADCRVLWDANDGASAAYYGSVSEGFASLASSNSFEVDGTTGGDGTGDVVPEPNSALLSGIGLLVLAGVTRSRLRSHSSLPR
jgi:hypothetical protein